MNTRFRSKLFNLVASTATILCMLLLCAGNVQAQDFSRTSSQGVVLSPQEDLPIKTYLPAVTKYPPLAIRWFVGLGTGSEPAQVPIEQSVVDDFNASQNKLKLVLELVPNDTAVDFLAAEIASGNSPDLVGPVGWAGSNSFNDYWMDLAPLIAAAGFDTSIFDPTLVAMYQTPQGQVGLPFATYPSAIFFNKALFDAAGLNYPPANYGDKYQMPGGALVAWRWDTVAAVGQLLTLDNTGKNATQEGFDKNNIVQYGFTWAFETHPNYWGSYFKAGSLVAPGGPPYVAQIPAAWKDAWAWMYTGIFGAQPFMATLDVENSPDFGSGNTFDSGKFAMTISPFWYTCCIANVSTWDFATMPLYLGQVGGRMDADTFRILKTSKHTTEAFTVMSYLLTTGVQKLIVGEGGNPPAYGGLPAIPSYQTPVIDNAKLVFPWVQNWDTLLAGVNYPDVPNAEAWMPHFTDAWDFTWGFGDFLRNTPGLDLATEETTLETGLTVIFNAP